VQRLASVFTRHTLRARLTFAVGGCLVFGALAAGLAAFVVRDPGSAGSQLSAPASVATRSNPALVWTILTATMAALVSALAAVHLLGRVFAALETMRQAANRVACGQREIPLAAEGNNEIGALARALNEMAASTAASYHEVEEQNRNLERIVRLSTEELRHKNLALAFQNEKVNEANKLKSAFLASVSHELRTPLNAILALSEMLRDQISGPLSEEQVKQASMIYRSGENLLHLINQVLDLSKIEAGRMEVHRESVPIVDMLVDAANALRPLAEEKGIVFEVVSEGEGVHSMVDAEKLRQVFVNLLGNAIKFTPRGSVRARIRLLQDENLLFVEVQDTGPGIAAEHQHLIFQEFQQVDRPTTTGKGTGLGLAISRRLVNLLGGDIWVDSERGKGARFAFVVPLTSMDQSDLGESRNRHAEQPVPRSGKQRVLVVDDDVVEAGVLARYLRQHGLEVLTALDGPEALHILRREPVNLVILDLLEPGEDAFQLVRRMREHPRLKPVPVVVNSSRQLSEDELSFLKPYVQSIFFKGTRGVGDLIAEVTHALHCDPESPGAEIRPAGVGGLEDVA
jgi:two-component system, chemotaxis family, sensor kinase CheA